MSTAAVPVRRVTNRRRRAFLRRQGATTVEFALVAPIFFAVLFAAVAFFGKLMTQNTLTAAAREGGRLASLPHVTTDEAVIVAIEDRLQRGGADPESATISVTPEALGSLATGDEISITVSMPVGKSTWLQFFGGTLPVGDLSAEITFLRE